MEIFNSVCDITYSFYFIFSEKYGTDPVKFRSKKKLLELRDSNDLGLHVNESKEIDTIIEVLSNAFVLTDLLCYSLRREILKL